MADIVNLRRARKDRARREREAEADANRRRFGRTRAEKETDKKTAERAVRTLEGKRLEPETKN
jgi:regulator of protease activity HflC (stomatin/prohibitin superfamily)